MHDRDKNAAANVPADGKTAVVSKPVSTLQSRKGGNDKRYPDKTDEIPCMKLATMTSNTDIHVEGQSCDPEKACSENPRSCRTLDRNG